MRENRQIAGTEKLQKNNRAIKQKMRPGIELTKKNDWQEQKSDKNWNEEEIPSWKELDQSPDIREMTKHNANIHRVSKKIPGVKRWKIENGHLMPSCVENIRTKIIKIW